MKNLFTLIALLIFVATSGFAQSKKVGKENFKPSHNVRVGWGTGIMMGSNLFSCGTPYGSPNYEGPIFITGAISAEYTYQPKRWLEFGANVSFSTKYNNNYDRITSQRTSNEYDTFVGMMLTARFNYLNKGIWRLYGQISLGAAIEMYGSNSNNGMSLNHTYWYPNFQLTPLGVAVGKKYYGFLELPSIGSLGVVNAGFGIRF